jgi:hypothetical protein
LYGSIAPDIVDMVMTERPIAFTIFTSITALFRDNQQARAGYLGQKFRNIEQGDKTITAYCLEQKAATDALADVGAPVTDDALVWNVIKGLDEWYQGVAALAPLLTPFPTFLQFRNMLLLQELQPSNAWPSSSSLTAFYSAPPIGGGQQRGGPAPAPTPAPYPVNNTESGSGYKGKKRKTTGGGAAAPFPSLQNPWTGAIHMYPMAGPRLGVLVYPPVGYPTPAGLLGPRPGQATSQRHRCLL